MIDASIMMPEFVGYIKKYISNPSIIVELGSMDGKDSLYLKECFPKATVYAIEGLEENYNFFKNMTQIIAIHAVVCNVDGEIVYYKKNVNGIHGIYDRGEIYGNERIISPCCKFKTLVKNVIKQDHIDAIKIDVEGAAYDVLLSMEDYIHNIGIMHIETESKEAFKGQVTEKPVFEYLINNEFEMINKACCLIEDIYQCDSVWVNKRFLL